MRRSTVLLLVTGLAVSISSSALAEATSHSVKVSVHSFSAISVEGGNVPLTMNGLLAEAQSAIDGTRCGLRWMTNEEGQKITVASSLTSPKVALTVEALNVTGGTPVGKVPVNGASQDLVIGLSKGMGRCNLRYVASSAEITPPQCDVHFLTYTITGG